MGRGDIPWGVIRAGSLFLKRASGAVVRIVISDSVEGSTLTIGDGGVAREPNDVSWSEIQNKPTEFPPTAHTHPAQTPEAHTHTFNDIAEKPTTFPPSPHTHANDHAPGSDNQDLSGLVVKVTGSSLVTDTEITKLAGVEAGANNYTHPANHPASVITQDDSNRFVTDTEKSTWNGKEPGNANIQTHIGSSHAPANAQANADITKAEIEAKLTGTIDTHSHAGGGSSPTSTCKQSAQVTNNSNTTPTDIPGMSFALVSGHRYYFRFMGTYQSAATTTGIGFTFSGPTMTAFHFWVNIQQAAAGTDQYYQNTSVTLTTVLVSTAAVAANTDYMFQVEGFCTPSANGTLQLRTRSEVNASQITVKNVGIGILEDAG
jgi:hypothetical protein